MTQVFVSTKQSALYFTKQPACVKLKIRLSSNVMFLLHYPQHPANATKTEGDYEGSELSLSAVIKKRREKQVW